MWKRAWAAWCLALLLLATGAEAARVALVIGNDAYTKVEKLKNARSDARAMGAALKKAGFEVEVVEDQGRSGTNRALRKFRQKIGGGDEVVFFFAGHGVEVAGANYLLPVDIDVEDEAHVRDDAIGLQELLDELREMRPRFTLAIVDACRDNPLKGVGRNVGDRGLKPVVAATGQMVIYSAGAGQKALDRLSERDVSPNGLFTRVFVEEMLQGGEVVQETVRRVRGEVSRLAQSVGREQVPALYDQSVGDFMFVSGAAKKGREPDAASAVRVDEDEQMWREARSLDTEEAYDAYLDAYPKGRYAKFAQAAKKKAAQSADKVKETGQEKEKTMADEPASAGEREAYEAAMRVNTMAALKAYLNAYPRGSYRSMAVAALEALERKASEPVATTTERQPSGSPRQEPVAPQKSTATSYADLQSFRECDGCPEMVVIPAGEYEMGSPAGTVYESEKPQHRVRVGRFALGKYEVTQGQWLAVMGNDPSLFRNCGDECPAEGVSWEDAQAYIRKLNEKVSGRSDGPYRLPSEAEWEYGCRGGVSDEDYCGGNDVKSVAWYEGNSGGKTQRVGTKKANRWGLHDMSGNVIEWVGDCWNANYRGAPSDGSAWTSGECSRRVARGGAWNVKPANVRSAYPYWLDTTIRSVNLGFRVARTLP